MREVTIGDLKKDGVLTYGDGYRTKRAEHGRPGFRILRVADVSDGFIRPDGDDFVAEFFRRQIGAKLSEPGDVLLTTKGTVGRVATVPTLSEQLVYSPQLCFFRVLMPEVLDRRFLHFWLKSPQFVSQASHRMNNTDMAAYINLADIRSLVLALPEISEQRAIAEVLGALDDKIAANDRLIATAGDLALWLTRAALTNKRQPLASIANIVMGSSPPGSSYNEEGFGRVFYQGVRDFGVRFPSNRVWTTAPVRMADAGDTLLSVRAPVGRTNLASEATCIGRGLAAVTSTISAPMTLFHLLRADPSLWEPFEAEGTVFGSINRKQLEAMPIAIVDDGRASELEASLSAIESRLSAAVAESASLARTRDALLPLLMSGKVTVKDAEKSVEEVV